MNSVVFHDPGLRAAVERAEQVFSSYTQRLNQISADIKSLEEGLVKAGIQIVVEYCFSEPNDFVYWQPCENGRWRLLYRHFVEGYDGFYEEDLRCPIIEASVEVRLAVMRSQGLSKLVELISKQIGEGSGLAQPETVNLDHLDDNDFF